MDEQNQNQGQVPAPVSARSNGVFFLIALIFAVIAAALFYLIWQQKNSLIQAPNPSAGLETVQKQVAEQQVALQALQMQLEQWQKKVVDRRENSVLRQVTYLVNLANLNLIADHDVDNAQRLLKMAMEKVALQNDPALSTLQKSLESDYSRLTAMASFNVENIILELDNVNKGIQAMSLMPNLEFKAVSPEKTTEKLSWTKRFLNSLSGLKDLFIIRHVGGNSVPLVSPQEEVFLKENIALKMMQAQWAVIHQKPLIFQRDLKDVEVWLKKYFHNPQSTQAILTSLAKLQALNVRPDFPGLDTSLKILEQLKQEGAVNKKPEASAPDSRIKKPDQAPPKADAPIQKTPKPAEPLNPEKSQGVKI